jgi:hypothetical protein
LFQVLTTYYLFHYSIAPEVMLPSVAMVV